MGYSLKYGLALVFGLLLCVGVCQAQFRLPPFNVELKVTESLIPNNDNNQSGAYNLDLLEATSVYGAAHLQFGQHIEVGWLYSQSFRGMVKYSNNGGSQSPPASEKASLLMYGPEARYSTGRGKKTRFSLGINYTQVEFTDDKGGYRLAHKTNAIGASFGIIRRLSNTIDFNIIELGAKAMLGEKAFWIKSDLMLEVKTGLIFNFSKRK